MAKQKNFPKIRGFEDYPAGKLLNQKVDFDGPIGIAYERCIGYTKPEHSHDRITITFSRGSSQSFITIFPERKKFSLHKDVVHFMSQDKPHEQGSDSTIYDTFAIFVSNDVYRKFLEKRGIKKTDIATFLETNKAFDRSPLLNEIVQRYFACRVLGSENHDQAYLESLLLNELYVTTLKKSEKPKSKSTLGAEEDSTSEETPVVRAIEFIESHLFDKFEIADVVSAARTSQATLFRLFKRDLKVSPLEYSRNRRLDEAKMLLKTKKYLVGDVGLLVGYEDISAFSKAYKLRFGGAPSLELD